MTTKKNRETDVAVSFISDDNSVTYLEGEVIDKPNKKKNPNSNVMLKRSNRFMEAKYKSTLMEKKLLTLGLSKMTMREGKLIATMNTSEIRDALGYSGNSLYQKLKELSAQAIQHYMFIKKDDKNQEFEITGVVDKVVYKNGVLNIYFNDAVKKHTLEVEKKYTLVPRNTLLAMKSNNTFTLYDLLMTHFYMLSDDDVLTVYYGLNELKFSLGLVDIYDKKISAALNKGMDYDDIVEKYFTKTDKNGNKVCTIPYSDWTNFRRRIIEPARKELDNSDLVQFTFTFKPVTAGRGGKTVGVNFFMKKKKTVAPSKKALERESKVDNNTLSKLMAYADGHLTSAECVQLLAKAENDYDKVVYLFNYTMLDKKIVNKVGWMISALDGNWEIPANYREQLQAAAVKKEPAESTAFNANFHQREYDFTELESQLLRSQMEEDPDEDMSEDMFMTTAAEIPLDTEEELSENPEEHRAEDLQPENTESSRETTLESIDLNGLDIDFNELDPEIKKSILEQVLKKKKK